MKRSQIDTENDKNMKICQIVKNFMHFFKNFDGVRQLER